MTSVRYDSISC